MSFSELQLSPPLLETLEEIGYTTPTPIQEKSIPAILSDRDVMAAAQTGTGKTAGFTLPLLEKLSKGPRPGSNQARALILTPTRELADQVGESVKVYSQKLNLRSTVVYGGVKINPQMLRLRKGVDVLVATPGRLLDLHQHNAVKFSNLEVLILDEADRMLDMGFIHDIKKIIKSLPKERQNLLFSATFSPQIQELAKTFIHDPIEISVSPRNSTAKTVKQWAVPVDKKEKPALLVKLIKDQQWPQVLVFCKTKHGSNRLVTYLEKNDISAVAIHGNKSQGARTRALEQFKNGRVTALVATDIAARGLDISQLPHVVNFDLPKVAEDYVHRIGRTGRAGSTGEAVSLLSADEFNELTGIERLIQKVIERVEIDGFEPNHCVPASPTTLKPVKKKRPKKKKKPNPQSQTKEQNRNSSNRTKRSAKPKSRPKNKTASSRRPAKPTNKRRPSK